MNYIIVEFKIGNYLYQACRESEFKYSLYRDNGDSTVRLGFFGSRPDPETIKQKAIEKIEATKPKKASSKNNVYDRYLFGEVTDEEMDIYF